MSYLARGPNLRLGIDSKANAAGRRREMVASHGNVAEAAA
jgi:hypothetical protein